MKSRRLMTTNYHNGLGRSRQKASAPARGSTRADIHDDLEHDASIKGRIQ